VANNVRVRFDWVEGEAFEGGEEAMIAERLTGVHGVLVPGAFGQRGSEGMIRAVRFAREHEIPYFGICFGMQMAMIEAARNQAGIKDASSTEFGPSSEPVVGLMTEWVRGNARETRGEGDDLGGANVQSGGDHANRPIGTEADRGQGPETRAANRDEVRGQG
ncbi:glutamine amidotransferase-related protein, partial [Priestia megaterium]|uniref:glutamine amidotransferase-related protein n=1 Tax=Priestia megaterium TaxID=1404 RepID=UPI0035B9D4D3